MNQRNEDRSRVTVHGFYRHGDEAERAAIIVDLSANGCRLLERLYPLPEGTQIMLSLGKISPFPAKICWVEGAFHGVEFLRPLHQVVLNHLYLGELPNLRQPLKVPA